MFRSRQHQHWLGPWTDTGFSMKCALLVAVAREPGGLSRTPMRLMSPCRVCLVEAVSPISQAPRRSVTLRQSGTLRRAVQGTGTAATPWVKPECPFSGHETYLHQPLQVTPQNSDATDRVASMARHDPCLHRCRTPLLAASSSRLFLSQTSRPWSALKFQL